MTRVPKNQDKTTDPDTESQREDEVLKRMLNTPPKPRANDKKKREDE
jgi:hypothetical protein